MIQIKRAYEKASREDGRRYLVDRMWPRAVKKESLKMDAWLKEVAPSEALRKWLGHDPARWVDFKRRYFAELKQNREAWEPIVQAAREGQVTLL
jgi:uncharacterized protein YeaO (DUF488 family)